MYLAVEVTADEYSEILKDLKIPTSEEAIMSNENADVDQNSANNHLIQDSLKHLPNGNEYYEFVRCFKQ